MDMPTTVHELRKEEKRLFSQHKITEIDYSYIQKPQTKDGRSICYERHNPRGYYFDIFNEIESILSDPVIVSSLVWTYTKRSANGERTVGELWTANWWLEQHQSLAGNNLLAITLSMDETPITYNGRNMHPVYVTLGNIPLEMK